MKQIKPYFVLKAGPKRKRITGEDMRKSITDAGVRRVWDDQNCIGRAIQKAPAHSENNQVFSWYMMEPADKTTRITMIMHQLTKATW